MNGWAILAIIAAVGAVLSGCCSLCSVTAPTPCHTDSDCAWTDCKESTPYATCLGAGENGTGICGCSSSPPMQPTPIPTATPHRTPSPAGTSTPAASQTPLLGSCPSGGGTISACPCTISTPGAYRLESDLTSSGTCITVTTGATLDCQGHSITGSGNPDSRGIYVDGASGATVRNCALTRFNCGIDLESSNGNHVMNNSATANRQAGLCVVSSSSNEIRGNTLSSNTYDGIFILTNSNSNTFTGNTCNSNIIGVYIHWDNGGSSNRFTNNTVTGSIGSSGDFHCEFTGAQVDGGGNHCGSNPRCSWLTCH